jgi:branched-chain amino acid transport system substrate-binding protein
MQGTVGAQWAKDLGAKSVYVVDDQDLYGSTLANAFEQTAKDIGLIILGHEKMNPKAVDYKTLAAKVKDANTDLFYFGGITQNNAGQLIKDLRSIGFKGMIMGPDGIYEEAFVKAAGSAADGVYLTFGGLPVDKLSGTGAVWRTAYRSKYGNDPEIYATYAYTAAQLAMDALDRVCQAGQNPADRKAVRDAVFATKDFDSVLGKFSIDANGDTTNTLMSGVQIKSGRFEFVTVLGK